MSPPPSSLRKTVGLGDNKRIDITIFNKKVYFHLHDYGKRKNLTLNRNEFDTLLSKSKKIKKLADKLEEKCSKEKGGSRKKKRSSSSRHNKKNRQRKYSSSAEDMSDDDDNDDDDNEAGSNNDSVDEGSESN